MLLVVYAVDINKVAAFYSRTLEMPIAARDTGFIIVGTAPTEIAIVRMSAEAATGVETASSAVRENIAVKASFLVDDLGRAGEAARENGGGTKPGTAWEWRGQLHLDGHDPEGNVVQFRQVIAQP